ncbi:MAG: NHL repeat-containing protein, partial [bacterium]
MFNIILLFNLIPCLLFSQKEVQVIDDATQPKMSRWTVNGPIGTSIGVDYVSADKKRGNVIRLRGFGLNNVFTYKGDKGETLNIKDHKTIQWKMKFETPFIVQIKVTTNEGVKNLLYSDLMNRANSNNEYLHIGIGSKYKDGTWKVVTRNIEKDLQSFLAKAELLSIDSISFRGSGYIDDIWAIDALPEEVLLNKGEIKGWDKIGKGGRIFSISDPVLDNVIEFDSGSHDVNFRLRNTDGSYWKIRTNIILQWKIKTKEPYKVFVLGDTLQGKYILSYDSTDSVGTYDSSNGIISYGLGKETIDGRWNVITRDVEQDIKKLVPSMDISSVSAFLVRGNGQITDIKLLAESPIGSDLAKDWSVYDNEPKGAEIKKVNDVEKGDVVETYGDGVLNGYKYTGFSGNVESDGRPFISLDMKFSEPFDVALLLQTDTIARYIHYVPKPVDFVEQKDGELYIGVGDTFTDNRWHTIYRDLDSDIKLINKTSKYAFCQELLLRGSGKIGKILFFSDNINESTASASAVASVAIGQFDLARNLKNLWDLDVPSPSSLFNPSGVAVDDDGLLYVSDTGNNRVLVWNKIMKTSGVESDITFFTGKLKVPTDLFIKDKKLFIADTGNNRVLVFKLPLTEEAVPLLVLSNLKKPAGVFYDGTKLFVADTGNNRVLIWNTLPNDGKVPFDVVLGQSSASRFESNKGSENANYNTMNKPSSVYSDGKTLYISDTGNNRILVFKQIPTMDGWHADLVIGQNNFTSNKANMGAKKPTAETLNQPKHLTISEGRLFVADSRNNRVL